MSSFVSQKGIPTINLLASAMDGNGEADCAREVAKM
jgi:hypothetical protein